jgi:hypothetical protein
MVRSTIGQLPKPYSLLVFGVVEGCIVALDACEANWGPDSYLRWLGTSSGNRQSHCDPSAVVSECGSKPERPQMNENPYQPSLVPPSSPPLADRRGSSVLAIFLGVLTDTGGSIVVGFFLSFALSFFLLSQGVPFEDLRAAFQSPIFWVPGAILGLGVTALGGFVAGRVAKRSEVIHGAITGCLSGLIGLVMHLWQSTPLSYAIPSLLLVPPTAMLGAWLSISARRRDGSDTEVP